MEDSQQQLCQLCSGFSIESLTGPSHFAHAETLDSLRQSSKLCKMCLLIWNSIDSNEINADPPGDGNITCRITKGTGTVAYLETAISGSSDWGGFVRIYTSQDDPAHEYGISAIVETGSDTASDISFVLAEALTAACLRGHGCDKPLSPAISEARRGLVVQKPLNQTRIFPSRLVYLDPYGEDSLDACLFDTAEYDSVFYAALSYCWGPNPEAIYKTTTANIDERKTRIVWSELPKTYQDAFQIARRLRIHCIWIDALCIVQDSEEDWERESSKMGDIYSNAFLTIAADTSESVNGGCFNVKNLGGNELMQRGVLHCSIKSILRDRRESTLIFHETRRHTMGAILQPDMMKSSRLSKRAWCLQERLLSKRILHYTDEGLVWECRETYREPHCLTNFDESSVSQTMCGALQILEHGGTHLDWLATVPSIENATPGSADGTGLDISSDQWLDIVQYAFSSPSDGLQAMGTYSTAPESRKIGSPENLASWWCRNVAAPHSARRLTFEKDRLPSLAAMARLFDVSIDSPYLAGIWLVNIEEGLEWRRAGPTYQNSKLDAPSFSWISHPGPVSWPHTCHVRPHGRAFDIEGYSVEHMGLDPFGRVSGAELKLGGHMRTASIAISETMKVIGATPSTIKAGIKDESGNEIGEAELDLDITGSKVECFLLYKNSFGSLRVLLLCSGGIADSRRWHRVGIGLVRRSYVNWLEGCERQVICLA